MRLGPATALAAVAAVVTLATLSPSVVAQPGSKDWVDSPFTGQGDPPPGMVTNIYMSIYVDRILYIDETKYTYEANFYIVLAWKDPRAQDEVQKATAASLEPGAECRRPCNGQKAPTPESRCCSSLYLPTILIRNVAEYPQGRSQAYTIRVEPDHTVMWRSEVRGMFYTTASYPSFPWDVQSLDLALSLQNNSTEGRGTAAIIPSASGVGLFAFGNGDDLSGWHITNITIVVVDRPWSAQYNDHESHNLRTRSAPGDPAPLVPAPGAGPAFGTKLSVVQVRVGIIVQRLSLFYSLSAIVPIILIVVMCLLTHILDPDMLETRLTVVVTLILSLTALQIVFEGDLPKSSYILPTSQLVLSSYVLLLISAMMSIVVYNVHSWVDVRGYWRSMAAARGARAQLRAAARRSPTGSSRSPRSSSGLRRSMSRIVSALAKSGTRFAPAPGGRFARNAPRDSDSDEDDSRGGAECGAVGGPAATRAAAVAAEAERGWFNWLAFVIDAVTLAGLAVAYTVVAIAIFAAAHAKKMQALE